ncbi:hypothetical protein AAJ72_08945 [Citromicrobium sp. RCC1885]|uniref:hypothetical protein n=1 Tax=unclassified Citromicrobium TaxID=2630544 RepID=UPI0006C903FA|nr:MULTISPECIES: hypothetical protein [unclassified Citromicrobium]KPM20383.1 hypothetical protein VO57_15790 [Citromicrobium sp. JL2201]KPM23039.1 hypothetical protein AAJ72_08945 [Citromicrobium sp. RCC1885]KPM27181.1 hypothetical protein AAJ74_09685 [Citromicrobium sp. RCC1878]OAM09047.1 hypothetical protein A0U43_10615 [Citromicrobium sp. RCC1897]|tara:strand:+ start:17031 stop:17225 length:195 start_codon:yes stop_codon:yes gene_type:complete
MPDAIKLTCRCCKRSRDYDRRVDPSLPSNVAAIETDLCDHCDTGDFGSETWFDAAGKQIEQSRP